MKNFKITITLIMCSLVNVSIFSQEKYTIYNNIYSNSNYEIQISSKDSTQYTLYIDMLSLDELSNSGGILINNSTYDKFISVLSEAQIKYNEWVKTAIENNVTELDKLMPITSKATCFFSYGSEWNFHFLIELHYSFKIIDNKKLLIIRTGGLTSYSNKFIKHKGFVLVFSSTSEITDFLKVLSKDKIIEYISKPKKEDLFK